MKFKKRIGGERRELEGESWTLSSGYGMIVLSEEGWYQDGGFVRWKTLWHAFRKDLENGGDRTKTGKKTG